MVSRVSAITCFGHEAVQLENDQLRVIVVPSLGSNVLSIVHKPTETPILRTPATQAEFEVNRYLNGIPVLFPPNRLEDGKLHFGDQTFTFDLNEPKYHNHLHGLVHDRPWHVTDQSVTPTGAFVETFIDAQDFPEILRQFPFRFQLRMRTEIDGERVVIAMHVHNASDSTIPWGLGYHTTFRFPFAGQSVDSSARFRLTAAQRWALSDRLLPTGALLNSDDLEDLRSGTSLYGKSLDDVFLSQVTEGGGNECVLTDPEAGLEVAYRADDTFLHWVVYTADGRQDYVCPEPYTWVTNAPNLKLDPSLTGLRTLSPGESANTSTEIVVRALPSRP